MVRGGWVHFMVAQEEYEEKAKQIEKWKKEHASSEKCPLCGNAMYIREGKYGKFLGCSKYPNCKGTKKIQKNEKK